MRLEAFIQQDIKTFLDEMFNKRKASLEARQIEGVELLTLSKDYEGDLKKVLQSNNLSKARDLFHDVLELYKHARSNEEKDLYYRILFNMYKELKKYLTRESETKTAGELVKELENMGVFSSLERRYPGTKKTITETLSTVLSQPEAIEYKPINIDLKKETREKPIQARQVLKHEVPIITETVNIIKHPEFVKSIKEKISSDYLNSKDIYKKEISLAKKALSEKNLNGVVEHYKKAIQAFKKLNNKDKKQLFDEGLSVYKEFNRLTESLNLSQWKTIKHREEPEEKRLAKTTRKPEKPIKVTISKPKFEPIKGLEKQEKHLEIKDLKHKTESPRNLWIKKFSTSSMGQEYSKALKIMKEGKILKAKELFEELVAKNPHHIAAKIRLIEIKELLKTKV